MKNLSRGAWLAIAAITAVPATVAIAKTAHHADWRLSADTRSRLEDGRLAMVKVALRLTPDQEKLWAPLEQQVRDTFKTHEAKRAERIEKRKERKAKQADKREHKHQHKHRDLAARYEKISQRLSDRAERMKAFSAAFTPFYASLSDEQKSALRPLMRKLTPSVGRHHGRHGHGSHWAFGGWGPGGSPHGHHHHHHHRRWSGDHNAPGMQDNRQQNNDNDDSGATQAEPDNKG